MISIHKALTRFLFHNKDSYSILGLQVMILFSEGNVHMLRGTLR